jgi:hypothetical protein
MVRLKEKAQALAEFALIMPVLILLLFGMTFAAFYAFRSASTDWGVFITGVERHVQTQVKSIVGGKLFN